MPLNNPALAGQITSGFYAGNNGINRAILHGLPGIPKVIFLTQKGTPSYQIIGGKAWINYLIDNASGWYAVTAQSSTEFFVGNATNYDKSANASGVNYYWQAFL